MSNRLILREACYDDIELLFNWANDPVLRKLAKNQNLIEWGDHVRWFKAKLNSNSILLLMQSGVPIGQIRFDPIGQDYRLSYSISNAYRGRGFGTMIVKKGLGYLKSHGFSGKIIAEVKIENLASNKIFEKMSFKLSKQFSFANETYNEYCKQI